MTKRTELLLVALGLYGVMNYSTARRTAEFGLRVTLGATRSDLARLIFGEGLMLVAMGVFFGIPLAMLAVGALRGHLSGLAGADPTTMVLATAVLGMSAICATIAPVLRATRVAPMEALRTA
jgi:ABC-type antimicrobial peptide transport system permease subunit